VAAAVGARPDEPDERTRRAEERLAFPVLVAALVSVPAVFLTTAEGTLRTVGTVLNWASVTVLAAETVVLLWIDRDVGTWLRRHRWKLLVLAVAIPAVVFVVGPVQILRLILSLGALRVLRAGRIVRAGRVIRRRFSLGTWADRTLLVVIALLAGIFVTIVLIDPASRSRRAAMWVVERIGVVPTILAGLVLAATAFVLVRYFGHRLRALFDRR
jgi:hypothetical protein